MDQATKDRIDQLKADQARDIDVAISMRLQGRTMYEIALATGRSKEWLRTNAGIR